MLALKRIARFGATVLASWLIAFIALVYVGLLPGFGIFTVLETVSTTIEEVHDQWFRPLLSGSFGRQTPLPPEAERLVEHGDSATAAGNFAIAARHYSDALRYTNGHPELLFSASRAYRFAGQSVHAAAFMLAYIEAAKLDRPTVELLLEEVDGLATAAGATGRRLFGIAVDGANRLPASSKSASQIDVMGEIARAGDVSTLKLLVHIAPVGMPEALRNAALTHASQWNRQLAREILDIAIASIPGAARASVGTWCRQSVSAQACLGSVVHPGFAGLPPVRTGENCPPPPPPRDPQPQWDNLSGLMLMGVASAEYHVGLRARAHRHWTEGHELLKASELDQLCGQPWIVQNGYITLKVGRDWVFMGDKGPASIPPGEDTMAPDDNLVRMNWSEVVAIYNGYLPVNVLPDVNVAFFAESLGSGPLTDLPAEIDAMNERTDLAARPLAIAKAGRAYYGAHAAIRAATASMRATPRP